MSGPTTRPAQDDGLLRIARRVHARLARAHRPVPVPPLPSPLWRECDRLERLVTRAVNRGWTAAAARLRRQLVGWVADLRYRLGDVQRALEGADHGAPRPTPASVYADLRALRDEFAGVRYDQRSAKLAVATEPIQLAGHELGPFEIVLRLPGVDVGADYGVVALDPRPCVSRASVTHPHVENERLCEGQGRGAIHRALDEGRLFDAFLVVASVLRTYNPDSAYVSLEDWDGVECHDCGLLVAPEDRDVCRSCRSELCEVCVVTCDECGHAACTACSTACRACGETLCDDCGDTCVVCREPCCRECMDEDHHCETCREEESEDDEAGAADDAVRVGEAPLPP